MHTESQRSHEDAIVEELRDDPACAAAYLSAVLEDGDPQEVATVLRRLRRAFDGRGAGHPGPHALDGLDAQALYRTLSPQGNPDLQSLGSLLQAMGLRLVIQPAAPGRT